MSVQGVTYGVFKEEIKNRFLCIVNVKGTDTVCYIPSSCRLSNFVNLNNKEVMLCPIKKRDARTKYAVCAIKYRKSYVPIFLSRVNDVVKEELSRNMFSFLGSRKKVYKERIIDGYKSDLYVEDTDTIIEIKSILSFDAITTFPTVYSERAVRQLEKLKELIEHGHHVSYMFISMYSGVREIHINPEYKEFCSAFLECIEKGMGVSAFSLKSADCAAINRRIKFSK